MNCVQGLCLYVAVNNKTLKWHLCVLSSHVAALGPRNPPGMCSLWHYLGTAMFNAWWKDHVFGNTTAVIFNKFEKTRSIVVPSKVVDLSINFARLKFCCISWRKFISFFTSMLKSPTSIFRYCTSHEAMCLNSSFIKFTTGCWSVNTKYW